MPSHEQLLKLDTALVKEACAIEKGLTQWEVNFVESLVKQVEKESRLLTEKQRTRLELILLDKSGQAFDDDEDDD